MNAYFLSGLGADKRAFQKIKLPDNYEIKHIEWIEPLRNETFTHYCIRLTDQMDLKEPFVLIGLSFGGVVVSEFNKIIHPKKSIIISSVTGKNQLPWYFKTAGRTLIHKFIPPWMLKTPNPFAYWVFGTKTKEEKLLLKQILRDTEPIYLKWAVHRLLRWKNSTRTEGIIHIHGSQDKIFPITNIKPDYLIEGGRHFMVVTLADEINEIFEKELSGF